MLTAVVMSLKNYIINIRQFGYEHSHHKAVFPFWKHGFYFVYKN